MPTIKELVDKIKQLHNDVFDNYEVTIETSQRWSKGASIEEITEFEKKHDITLPPDIKEWFLEINGEPNASFPFFFGNAILSLEEIENDLDGKSLKTIPKREIENIESVPKDSIYPRQFGSGVIPLVEGDYCDYVGVDLIPNINGTYGQILIYGSPWYDKYPFHVVFKSWKEYLINFINDYENKHELEVEIVHDPDSRYRETNGYRFKVLNARDCYFYDLYQEILGFKRHIDDD